MRTKQETPRKWDDHIHMVELVLLTSWTERGIHRGERAGKPTRVKQLEALQTYPDHLRIWKKQQRRHCRSNFKTHDHCWVRMCVWTCMECALFFWKSQLGGIEGQRGNTETDLRKHSGSCRSDGVRSLTLRFVCSSFLLSLYIIWSCEALPIIW